MRERRAEGINMTIRSFRLPWILLMFLQLGMVVILSSAPALYAQGSPTSLAAPEVRSHRHVAALTLHAVRRSDGRDSFAFNGQTIPPIIRLSPGDTLRITYVNDLPPPSGEQFQVGEVM